MFYVIDRDYEVVFQSDEEKACEEFMENKDPQMYITFDR